MSVRSRHAPPPYQVMKAHPPQAAGQGSTAGAKPGDPGAAPLQGSLPSGSTMVTLRLPRGFAVLLVGLFLSAILLAFWVGSTWGQHRALQESQFDQTLALLGEPIAPGVAPGAAPGPNRQGFAPSPAVPPSTPAAGATAPRTVGPRVTTPIAPPAPAVGGPAVVVQGSQRDARQAGLNYFTANLVGATQDEAIAVVEYLWQEGVEAQVIKLHNSRLFQLTALRGFAREELGAAACKAYERQLQQLGRQWKQDPRNPRRVDFSGIYPARYDTPSNRNQTPELVITRKS